MSYKKVVIEDNKGNKYYPVTSVKNIPDIEEVSEYVNINNIEIDNSTSENLGDTITNIKKEINNLKQSGVESNKILVDALNSKGVWASTSSTIKTNTNKVKNIKVGDYSIGDIVKSKNIEKTYGYIPSKIWEFTDHSSWVSSIAVDNKGYVYSGADDEKIMKISPSGSKVWEFTGYSNDIRSVAVDNEGYVYGGSYDRKVMKISPSRSKVWEFTGHTSSVNSVAVDNEGYVYSGSSDTKVMKISPIKFLGYKIIA